jgi:hypothetical protein
LCCYWLEYTACFIGFEMLTYGLYVLFASLGALGALGTVYGIIDIIDGELGRDRSRGDRKLFLVIFLTTLIMFFVSVNYFLHWF